MQPPTPEETARAAERSAAWVRVARFFDGPLSRWRHAHNPKMSQMPPSFDPRETEKEVA
jgi:hypothetical protein